MAEQVIAADQQDSPAPDAADADSSRVSDSAPQEPSGPGWFNRLIGRAAPAEADEVSEGEAAEPRATDESAGPGASTDTAQQPFAVYRTQAEHDRAVQAEVDRRAARRAADERSRAERERLSKLRDEDPYAYADATKEAEVRQQELNAEAERQAATMRGTVEVFDRAVLDPLVLDLPEQHDLRKKLAAEGGPVGIDGRAALARDAIAAIRADERAKVEKKLRTDRKFREGLFREFRGEIEEPDVAPAAAASRGPSDMNDVIRRALGVRAG